MNMDADLDDFRNLMLACSGSNSIVGGSTSLFPYFHDNQHKKIIAIIVAA